MKENNFQNSIPFSEYPRPQMKRDSFFNLNGTWKLNGKDILVPFPPESQASIFNGKINSYLEYTKEFVLPDDFSNQLFQNNSKNHLLLHFGAVDQIATIFVNDVFVGTHHGGYLPFYFDITDYLTENSAKQTIKVIAKDTLNHLFPYGKQKKNRGGMWYTPISGIWQTVWCESVPVDYIKGIKVTPSLNSVHIDVDAGEGEKILALGDKEYRFEENAIDIEIENPIHWTPDDPYLYEFSLVYGKDRVESYFALRTVSIEIARGRSYIHLNGKPILCHGLLDQGYYSDGIYLPATPKGYELDILTMKKLGFNMLRKHIKIEPQLFYYYCDKYGMLVFQDMVNSGKYSFLIDTALPTIGLKKGITHKVTKARREAFENDSRATIDLLYNHPSVIYYTIFNEGWGQFDADENYLALKEYDSTRVYDATSGWFWEKHSDVHSEHIYFKKLKLKARIGRPLVLSEFGGYSCKLDDHSFNLDNTYGYSKNNTMEEFECKFIALYDEQVIPYIKGEGLCALVYTQVSDVEDETNGLFTYDRQVLKVNEENIKVMSERLYRAFDEITK